MVYGEYFYSQTGDRFEPEDEGRLEYPVAEPVFPKAGPGGRSAKNLGRTAVPQPNHEAWSTALRLAGDDPSRLVPQKDGSIYVANTEGQFRATSNIRPLAYLKAVELAEGELERIQFQRDGSAIIRNKLNPSES